MVHRPVAASTTLLKFFWLTPVAVSLVVGVP
jgi:hypothetical protein